MNEYILETKNLTKKYGSFTAVDNVNLHVKKGDIYGFIGKNGAGKSTCMKMFSGLSRQTSGEISLLGGSGESLKRNNVFRKVGSLIEAPGMYPNMSAYDNLKLLGTGIGGISDRDIYEALEIVNLTAAAKKKTRGFSLGMKQRLGIATALLGKPEFLILDEPINGLDPQGVAEIRKTITALNEERGITVMISSHILEELSKIAKTIGIIHKGKMLREFSREEFSKLNSSEIELRTPDFKKAHSFFSENPGFEFQISENGVFSLSACPFSIGELASRLFEKGVEIKSVGERALGLEEYYLSLTNN